MGPYNFINIMLNPLITLTTDFGVSDHFVGTMKGVIAGIAPKARVIDITHEIAPYAIAEGAFVIAQAWSYFPKRTIHVVVVDPGVGSARRPILAECGGQFLIAPDNGVLSMALGTFPHKVREITNPRAMLKQISRTFHGRDIFAPAAAHLAAGMKPAQFGKLITDAVQLEAAKPQRLGKHQWRGTVLRIDRFGNLITSFHVDHFEQIKTRPFELRAGGSRIRRLALHYAETEMGELFVIVGSSGYLEIAVNQSSAAKKLGCAAGTPVELEIFYP